MADDLITAHLIALGETLKTCLCEALIARGNQTPVCACFIQPGDQVIPDYCGATRKDGADGQAWVRLVRLFNSVRFPAESIDSTNIPCNLGSLAAEFELGVLRCARAVAKTPPDPAKVTEDALREWRDAVVLRWVAACCLPKGMTRVTTAWQPISYADCVGGSLTVIVKLAPGVPIETTPV